MVPLGLKTLLAVALASALRPPLLPARRAAALQSLPQDDPFKASVNIGLSERFSLAYTCCKCDTRNLVSVSRVAWTTGLVIGKCRGCDAKHMLADNGGLTDETNSSRFSNVVNAAIAKGEAVGRLGLDDALALAEAGVEVLPGGNVSLVPRGAEEAVFDESGAVVATKPGAEVEGAGGLLGAEAAPAAPAVAEDEEDDVAEAKPPLQLPARAAVACRWPGAGGVPADAGGRGIIHVRVPDGAAAGSRTGPRSTSSSSPRTRTRAWPSTSRSRRRPDAAA
ncbi:zinc ion binding protein [Aureococcus anophagefferens]|nr:zinc ion binding protein [Aureococcus anophagefferens]